MEAPNNPGPTIVVRLKLFLLEACLGVENKMRVHDDENERAEEDDWGTLPRPTLPRIAKIAACAIDYWHHCHDRNFLPGILWLARVIFLIATPILHHLKLIHGKYPRLFPHRAHLISLYYHHCFFGVALSSFLPFRILIHMQKVSLLPLQFLLKSR